MIYATKVLLQAIFLAITLWQGRRYWLLMEAILLLGTGFCYIFCPHFLLETVTGTMIGEYDECHYFLLRVLGIIYLASMVICLRGSNYREGFQEITLLRTFGVATSLETMCHIQYLGMTPDPDSTLQHIPETSMPGFIFSVAGNVVHLIFAEYVESQPQTSLPLSRHLRIDAFCVLFLGIAMFAYPDLVLTRLTSWEMFGSAHQVIASVIGSYLIGYSVLMFQAPCFKSETDKRILLLGRLVEVVFIIAVILVTSTLSDLIPLTCAAVAASIVAVVAGNAFIGYTLPPKSKPRKE